MRILAADDDPISLNILETLLPKWGLEVVPCRDGEEAWRILEGSGAPPLAILDWMMPRLDGLEVCRRIRAAASPRPPYIFILTTLGRREDVITGLEAGANDYVTKPFDQGELHARVQVGVRMVELQGLLADRVRDLEEALKSVKQLRGLLPICSYCKKVRDDRNYWKQVETYVAERSDAEFSHGICPDCYETIVKPEMKSLKGRRRRSGGG